VSFGFQWATLFPYEKGQTLRRDLLVETQTNMPETKQPSGRALDRRFSVAPMMDSMICPENTINF